ncbi:MAG: fumarylacetoacetate hydrolase family protein [Hyphomicrobiales bacterium]|nr:fumarylacetoacetate hydrolase family protein [Hyphomicrobiales bacterium]
MTEMAETANAIASDIAGLRPFRQIGINRADGFSPAYDVQDAVVDRLIAASDRSGICGYKLAFNSAALLEKLEIDEPGHARIFADQRCDSPAVLDAGGFHTLVIEPEIAAIFNAPLGARSGGHDRNSVIGAIDRFVPAFELLDLRGAALAAETVVDIVAHNIFNAGIVIGGPGCAPDALDVDAVRMTLSVNGETVAEVTGAVPQHPLDAIAWLADRLGERGRTIEAGMVVLCGTHTPPRPVSAPARLTMEMSGLGSAEFSIA